MTKNCSNGGKLWQNEVGSPSWKQVLVYSAGKLNVKQALDMARLDTSFMFQFSIACLGWLAIDGQTTNNYSQSHKDIGLVQHTMKVSPSVFA